VEIVDAKWCVTRPSVIFVLDRNSTLHIFDLLSDAPDKLILEQDVSITKRDQRVQISMKGIALPQIQQQQKVYDVLTKKDKQLKMAANNMSIVLGYEDGRLDLHVLNESFNSSQFKNDIEATEHVLSSLFISDNAEV
jgi:hypothetical protein